MILWGFSKIHPHVRKHLKKIILPPLTAKDLKVNFLYCFIETEPPDGSLAPEVRYCQSDQEPQALHFG